MGTFSDNQVMKPSSLPKIIIKNYYTAIADPTDMWYNTYMIYVNYIIIAVILAMLIHPSGIKFLHRIDIHIGLFIWRTRKYIQDYRDELRKELDELKREKRKLL